ncbi:MULTISPECIES: TIGR02444 family protein [unclassified Pseudomonas]|uniref:TIGR02444 family protein n=1 Tax=unclassified Pseudomonas TaxID=196821 RepID=UPI002AC9BE6F|nr:MULTISPECIES: TIGR02444 family protein [unclassified Pseudomonas]MEB0043890.1 TIGR02444 family protein [Pseudomonas sp. Dout3]MEB0095172.1 TIGR02444 family protein [Pseudomonas sp. DC1.2]WPX58730.1 TIGR02444 family protein [Pseudomonas sp. DC1.2]
MSSDLWSFSLNVYASPGTEQACLQLQSAGANVCLLLCGLWLEQRGVACNEQRLQALFQVAGPWEVNVVHPLRTLRTQWKAAAADDVELNTLREQIKALELEAERHLLLQLERAAQSWPQDEVTDPSAWLEGMAAGAANLNHDALHQLRVAVTGT